MDCKIALCFLTYDNLSQPKLWSKFLNSQDSSNYNVYIHNKNDFTGEFKKYSIQNKIEHTKYAHISLIEATIALFKEAYNTKENKFFILLSDKCIPLYNANHIYNEIIKYDNNIILSYFMNKDRFHDLQDKTFFNINDFVKQNQWMILNRNCVNFFIENNFTHIFGNKIYAPDEHYFINVMHKYNIPFVNKKITYTNWDEKSDNLRKYRSMPKTYSKLTNEMVQNILKSECFFMRKIAPECILPSYFDNI